MFEIYDFITLSEILILCFLTKIRNYKIFILKHYSQKIQKGVKMYTRIYEGRTRLRISHVQLSELSGVSQSQLSKYEKGEVTRPSHAKLVSLPI